MAYAAKKGMDERLADLGRELDAKEADASAKAKRRKGVKAARGLLGEASARCGDESLDLVVIPTIERVLRGDVAIALRPIEFGDTGVVRVLRSASALPWTLRRMNIADEMIHVALRFSADFEKSRLGGLTANYEGVNPNGSKGGEPERWLEAVDLLSKASARLDDDERLALYGVVLFDVSLADIGERVAGAMSKDRNMWINLTKFLTNKALNKLSLFYDDYEFIAERQGKEGIKRL